MYDGSYFQISGADYRNSVGIYKINDAVFTIADAV